MVMHSHLRVALLAGASAIVLAGCDSSLDLDFRGLANGLDTSEAATNVTSRPRPDARGVITYSDYQVVVARRNDTVRIIADRLGINAQELANYNGLDADVPLRRDEIVALPARVGVAVPTGTIAQPDAIDVTDLASSAIDRADAANPAGVAGPVQSGTIAPTSSGTAEPIRHQVQRGETIYTLSRAYGVPVRGIARWNGLGPDLAIREGQYLLIPVPGAADPVTPTVTPSSAETTVTEPGIGSVTPTPPSAQTPLPDEAPSVTAPLATPTAPIATPEVPDLGSEQTETRNDARLRRPVEGPIIRAYSRGRNDGIDIGVAAGTPVRAAASGTVAAVTSNTDGASIVVIRHSDGLLTVYVNLEDLSVEKNDTVSAGEVIAKIPAGDPSFLHFEVRNGLESVDPTGYLP
ncbi:peptidoglycan DD-metalloendopeptidase family protein [Aestuariibius sp. HNIBRBA575]|uniref:peptidoglycan DD-metalloendopeptidase family protein n=1 Tax=Aestuariibius sp. HNIBRBA575 TaxID=3233343 RepID=UPI0034A298D4